MADPSKDQLTWATDVRTIFDTQVEQGATEPVLEEAVAMRFPGLSATEALASVGLKGYAYSIEGPLFLLPLEKVEARNG